MKWHVDYYVKDDFSVTRTTEFQVQALTENAVKNLKRHRLSYSTSIEELKVVRAYTGKADGTHLDVPDDNYQITLNKGNGKGGPVFSDRTKMSIVFPDLEVGDSIVLVVENTELEPMFPKNFSASQYFYSESAYEDVKVSINVPENLEYKFLSKGMAERTIIDNGRKIIELTYSNPNPIKSWRKDFSVWEWQTQSGFAISTFQDYESISRAYGERASPKAVPTHRVRMLAREIIGPETDKHQQAVELYNWVAINISYAGNCIGVGAVVPHDTDFILDNRIGDCKDHATLLQALYSSVGINSTQALINSGSSYHLPSVPMVSSVNHVINYIPEFDKFVDATNDSMPFDLLGFSVSDKPVLLVDGFKQGFRTPATLSVNSRQELHSKMSVQSDGSVTGTIHIEVIGEPAVRVRALWRDVTVQMENEWIEAMFSSEVNIGSGSIKKEDPKPLLSDYKYSFKFHQPDYILSEGAGGFSVGPIAYVPMAVSSFLDHSNEDVQAEEVACGNGYSIEYLEYEFPDNIRILASPEDFSIAENYLTYRASYALTGNKLSIVRELNDETPGNVCAAQLINAQRETIIKILKNLRSQVVYQYF